METNDWIIVDTDGSWHALTTSTAVKIDNDMLRTVDEDYGNDLSDYIADGQPVLAEGTLVVWEDVRDSIALAMSSEHIHPDLIASILATADDAIANNVYG